MATTTYVMAGIACEQVCTDMCPYARFQSVMFDRDTLIVSLDRRRGEGARGRSRPSRALKTPEARAAAGVALLALLICAPWAILTWPGADVFAIHVATFLTAAFALAMVGGRVGRGWHRAPALIIASFFVVAMNVESLGVAERGITGLFARSLPDPRGSGVADSRLPGTISHDYQQKEALYNAYRSQVEAQRARGWRFRKGWLYQPVAGQPTTFVVTVSERGGDGVAGAEVRGEFLRSSNSRADRPFRMDEVAPGKYRGQLEMPIQGFWYLVLRVRVDGDLHEVHASNSVLRPVENDR